MTGIVVGLVLIAFAILALAACVLWLAHCLNEASLSQQIGLTRVSDSIRLGL